MKAFWRGLVVAESDATRTAGGYTYFPRESVRMDLLRTAPKTASDLECPHGVQFYDICDGARESTRAAWSYEAPQSSMRPVERFIGFWEDVELVAGSGG